MVLPHSVDEQVLPPYAFTFVAAFFQNPSGCSVARHHIGFDPVEAQGGEGILRDPVHRLRHISPAYVILIQGVAEEAGSERTPHDVIYMLRKTHTLACGMKAAFLYLDR